MKKTLLLLAVVICGLAHAKATTDTVQVNYNTFMPSSFTAKIGDTILWSWAGGTHTTTSINIPKGASPWNSNINATTTSFIYLPTVAGMYSYRCEFDASMGMIGSFTVIGGPTSVSSANSQAETAPATQPLLSIYPNPVAGRMHLLFDPPARAVTVSVNDVTGKQVTTRNFEATKEAEINMQHMPDGFYFISADQDGTVNRQWLVVKH